MHITRRRFSTIAITTVGLGAVGFPAFPEGSPPSDSQGTPKPKTKTGGATTTRKKPVECCIDNKKPNALKRKIREIARHHNQLARRNMDLRKLAEKAVPEINSEVGKASGLTRKQLSNAAIVESSMEAFLDRGRDFSDEIHVVGNRLNKAELNCDRAAKTESCSQRKKHMRNALRELDRAASDMTRIEGAGVGLTFSVLGKLPKPLTKRLRKTEQFLNKLDSNNSFWKSSTAKARKQLAALKTFREQMLADC